jgi:hypothetical protein
MKIYRKLVWLVKEAEHESHYSHPDSVLASPETLFAVEVLLEIKRRFLHDYRVFLELFDTFCKQPL